MYVYLTHTDDKLSSNEKKDDTPQANIDDSNDTIENKAVKQHVPKYEIWLVGNLNVCGDIVPVKDRLFTLYIHRDVVSKFSSEMGGKYGFIPHHAYPMVSSAVYKAHMYQIVERIVQIYRDCYPRKQRKSVKCATTKHVAERRTTYVKPIEIVTEPTQLYICFTESFAEDTIYLLNKSRASYLAIIETSNSFRLITNANMSIFDADEDKKFLRTFYDIIVDLYDHTISKDDIERTLSYIEYINGKKDTTAWVLDIKKYNILRKRISGKHNRSRASLKQVPYNAYNICDKTRSIIRNDKEYPFATLVLHDRKVTWTDHMKLIMLSDVDTTYNLKEQDPYEEYADVLEGILGDNSEGFRNFCKSVFINMSKEQCVYEYGQDVVGNDAKTGEPIIEYSYSPVKLITHILQATGRKYINCCYDVGSIRTRPSILDSDVASIASDNRLILLNSYVINDMTEHNDIRRELNKFADNIISSRLTNIIKFTCGSRTIDKDVYNHCFGEMMNDDVADYFESNTLNFLKWITQHGDNIIQYDPIR